MKAEEAANIFEAHRPRLMRIAYRMLGSLDEAEDIVQDAWVRWQRVDWDGVHEPSAFLTRTVTRLCLDTLKSARSRREVYFGNWLPEPVVPEEEYYPNDELTLTLMLALERLSPLERAAFLLHDVFETPLEEVAATLNRDAGAVRQLAVRARRHVQAAHPRYPVAREEGERIAGAFFTASQSGDVEVLRALLAEDVTLQSDGGGKVRAFPNPIVGLDRVVRLLCGLSRKFGGTSETLIKPIWIDGLPGYASLERGVLQTSAFALEEGRIIGIYVTRNPDKLSRIAKVLGLEETLMPSQCRENE